MAQNITLLGASYSDVPAVKLPKTGGGTATFTDVADTTATASDVSSSKYFYTAAGVKTQGSAAAKTSANLTVSGATVTAPAGLYASNASASVASGSATTPATTITANPSISVSSSGLITASASATKSVTPTVSAGYVSSGTAGTITVSGSNTQQLTTQAAQTLYPSTTDQTIASGKYLTGTQTFKGILLTNLTAGNIKKNVVVKVGDSIDDDRITSVTGTYEGSGGGGSITGLVYESGTWTPSEDVRDYTISFTDTHTTAPFYYVITDDSATYSSTTNSNYVCMFFSPYLFCGAINMGANSSTGGFYAYTWHRYRATDANTLSSATNTSFTVESNISNWATSTGIRAYCTNGTRYWRAARTYKWVAVWAPET